CSRVPPPLPSFPTRRSSDLDVDDGLRVGDGLAAHRAPLGHVLDVLKLKRAVRRLADAVKGVERLVQDSGKRPRAGDELELAQLRDRKSTRLNSSHVKISYAV